jgi:outer membrane protein OmpA-like peptidoglycan-associated protein
VTSLLAAAWLCWAGVPARARPPAQTEPWSTERFSEAELRGSRELIALLARIDRGELPRIEFELDSDAIHPDSFQTLDVVANFLLKNQNIKIRISAHTCSLGSDTHNQELSERRAKAVADYLSRQGVPPPSIRWRGWGSSQPIADNSTEAGRRRNRRVEFHILRNDWDSIY